MNDNTLQTVLSHPTMLESNKMKMNNTKGSIKIGPEFQAVIPDFKPQKTCKWDAVSPDFNPKKTNIELFESLIYWTPTEELTASQLEDYLKYAKDNFNYSIDHALALLFWNNHDIAKSKADLPNYSPIKEKWTDRETCVFVNAVVLKNKQFGKICSTFFPDKDFKSLVEYYYDLKNVPRIEKIFHSVNGKVDQNELRDALSEIRAKKQINSAVSDIVNKKN